MDWGPFFQTWSLFGPFPAILDDKVVGEQARKVYADGLAMMKRIVEGRWLTANGVVGFYPANSINDEDIEIYKDETRSEVLFTYRNLRQQGAKREGVSNKSLSDFIAPKSSGKLDYVGMFAVTAGLGIEKKEAEFERALDDYSSIMLKSLADRLAEGFAECLHARVRQDLWGYAPDEALSNDDMIAEKYVGIRPAPGYPACPEHVVKTDMFRVLDGEDIGMMLTDSYAMYPASSVSGFYFSHPQSQYFNVGVIGEDQLEDYARRSAAASRTCAARWRRTWAERDGQDPSRAAEAGSAGFHNIPDTVGEMFRRRFRRGRRSPRELQPAGGASLPSTASSAKPMDSTLRSSPGRPSISKPTGKPAADSPAGMFRPGRPALLPGSVLRIRRMKCSMPLACASAVIGSTGSVGNSSASRRWLAKALL